MTDKLKSFLERYNYKITAGNIRQKFKKNNTMIDYLGILIKKYGGILIAGGD